MKRSIFVAVLVLVAAVGSTGFAWDIFNPEVIESPVAYGASYGPIQKDFYGLECGCGPKYYKCKCPKPKYFVKVCRTRVTRKKTGHGCHKKICLVQVSKVSYRRVHHPGKFHPDDVICALHRPPTKITREPLCNCCGLKGVYGATPYYSAPALPQPGIETTPLPAPQ